MSHTSGYRRSESGRTGGQYKRPPLLNPYGDRVGSPGRSSNTRTRTPDFTGGDTGSRDFRAAPRDQGDGWSAGSHHSRQGSRTAGRGEGFLRRSISEGHSIPTLPEEQIVSGELRAGPPVPDISNIPNNRSHHPTRSYQPPLAPLREPPYLAPEPPVDEEDDYEYPLVDCACVQIYWSTFFANFCSKTLGVNLKHCSKKGTPAHGNMRPVKEGRVFKALRKVGEKANKKGTALKREWTQRRPTWNYQDAHFQQMELELQRLRKQLSEQNSLPSTLPPSTTHEPWSSSQFRLPPSNFNGPNSARRFTMS